MPTRELDSAGSQSQARLPPVIGLIGTLMVCAAVMIAHLSAVQLKPVAIGLWFLGLFTQAVAFGVACAGRKAEAMNRLHGERVDR
jgi:hypothetical protein